MPRAQWPQPRSGIQVNGNVGGIGNLQTRLGLSVNEGMTRCRPAFVNVGILLGEIIGHGSTTSGPDKSLDIIISGSGDNISSAVDIDSEDALTSLAAVPVFQMRNNASSMDDSGRLDLGYQRLHFCLIGDIAKPVLDLQLRLDWLLQIED